MWPLTNGLRCLEGDEANLFRGAVGMMVDQLVIEINERIEDEQDALDQETRDPDDDGHRTRDQESQDGELFSEDQNLFASGATGEFRNPIDEALTEESPDWLAGENSDEFNEPPNEFDEEGLDLDQLPDGFGFETPHWYSMWEPEQQIWLLERVTSSLLTAKSAPPASAMFEATVEAVYVELADLIAMEITAGSPIEKGSWRASLLDAYVQRCPKDSLLSAMQFEATTLDPCLPPSIKKQIKSLNGASKDSTDDDSPESLDWLNWWTVVIERLVDATYGPRLYHDAELHRDGDPRELQRYLRSKGLNSKFCSRIPPLRSHDQTQASIDRLQAIVFHDK